MKPFFSTTADFFGMTLKTGFHRFSHPSGIDGLGRIDSDCLYLLAVHALQPGTGQFSAFLKAAKDRFERIEVLQVWSAELALILAAKGFDPIGCGRWEWRKAQPFLKP